MFTRTMKKGISLLLSLLTLAMACQPWSLTPSVFAGANDLDETVAGEETIDFADTLTVEEFVLQLLQALGKDMTMKQALKKEYVRYPGDYGSYEKPILRREAALTMARLMDELTNMEALFTGGKNKDFVLGKSRYYTLSEYDIFVLNWKYGDALSPLVSWQDYKGHVSDIRMLTPEYEQEMMTLYLTGFIDLNEDNGLDPYGFLTMQEAENWINRMKEYAHLSTEQVYTKLMQNIRPLVKKPLPDMELPAKNNGFWSDYSPYVDKSVYEAKTQSTNKKDSNVYLHQTANTRRLLNRNYLNSVQIAKNYFNTFYTVDYRHLDEKGLYFGAYDAVNRKMEKEGDYRTRTLYYFNPAYVLADYKNKEGKYNDESKWLLPDRLVDQKMKEYEKYKIVSQAEFVTDDTLVYLYHNQAIIRGTMRIIFYPPTDEAYLKKYDIECGKWYEADIEIKIGNLGLSGRVEKYFDRWNHSKESFLVLKDIKDTVCFYGDETNILKMPGLRPLEILPLK